MFVFFKCDKMDYELTEIIELANQIMKITNYNICNHCLGRKFSHIVEGKGNEERGAKVRDLLGLEEYSPNNIKCTVCDDIFLKVNKGLVEIANEKIDYLDLEFNNFLVGSKIPKSIIEKDLKMNEDLELDVETIKKEVNRDVGKIIEANIDREVEFDNPEIVMVFNFIKDEIRIQINPLFIYGRYRKLKRGIPQTKWPCRECRGKGCERCNFTGQMYDETVESLISEKFLEETNGYESKFHGAGREDIDVLMLGTGRPFVLEIKEPKRRNLDLAKLEKIVNESSLGKAEFLNLEFVKRSKKVELKVSSPDTYKVYMAYVECEKPINSEDLAKVKELSVIKQRTPVRVSHRRADKIREREVKEVETELIDKTHFKMKVKTQGGLYIKELISGDFDGEEYRSNPNLSSILDNPSVCTQLDVIEVGK